MPNLALLYISIRYEYEIGSLHVTAPLGTINSVLTLAEDIPNALREN